jgi:excisionase family DNA binding protein
VKQRGWALTRRGPIPNHGAGCPKNNSGRFQVTPSAAIRQWMSLQQRFKNKKPESQKCDITRQMMSPKEVADYLGQSVDLIYEKIKSGELPFVPKGNGNRKLYTIDRYDLDKLIEKNKVGVL